MSADKVIVQPKLFAAQREGVRRFLASDGRLLLTYGTGVGKTPTAICAMTRRLSLMGRKDPRILIICPAIVRRHWCAEFKRWASMEARPIEMGRHRKSGSKKALQARDEAYACRIQVVSHDLLTEIEPRGWDGIIFDEIHHLSDYTSRQSRTARSLVTINPNVPMLGLSATLIPTKVHQLWHPLHLFWPREWGRAPRAGNIPWQFVARYQEILDDGYGKRPGPAREDMLQELHERLEKVSHRLLREDIAHDLPPVDARAMELPGNALDRPHVRLAGTPRPEVTAAKAWVDALQPDIHHAIVICYHRDLCRAIATELHESAKGFHVFAVDGSVPPGSRIELLAAAQAVNRCVLVATSESVAEGIRLMWAQRVLYVEWRQEPKKVIQTLGRFTSVGDPRKPQIDILTDESLRDKAATLLERIDDINGIMRAGSTEVKVAEVFKREGMTQEQLRSATQAMFAKQTHALDPEWVEVSEETDDGW